MFSQLEIRLCVCFSTVALVDAQLLALGLLSAMMCIYVRVCVCVCVCVCHTVKALIDLSGFFPLRCLALGYLWRASANVPVLSFSLHFSPFILPGMWT